LLTLATGLILKPLVLASGPFCSKHQLRLFIVYQEIPEILVGGKWKKCKASTTIVYRLSRDSRNLGWRKMEKAVQVTLSRSTGEFPK